MSQALNAQYLSQRFTSDSACCEQLLDLLYKEQHALKERDADTIDQILKQKAPLLEQLENSAKEQQHIAKALSADLRSENWLEQLNIDGAPQLKEQWQSVKDLYQKVRAQNEINGKLLSRHQKTVSRLLDIVRGKTTTPNLYTSSGYSSSQANSNNIGEA
ncbi:flagella synthesis protein FlgN [Agaribacterium sp. ZY112]|uniref:flagella synthesis protein FlgN n=1 Tax=Agaribacterium sp. ZY112 TaxID=3233574 RepID=UPI0035256B55